MLGGADGEPLSDSGQELELVHGTRERTHSRLTRARAGRTSRSRRVPRRGGRAGGAGARERSLDPLLAVLLVLAFAWVSQVEFAGGALIVVPTQIVFVPLLLLLPMPLVPLFIAAALVLSDVGGRACAGGSTSARIVIAPANAWFSVAPGAAARARRRADAANGRSGRGSSPPSWRSSPATPRSR